MNSTRDHVSLAARLNAWDASNRKKKQSILVKYTRYTECKEYLIRWMTRKNVTERSMHLFEIFHFRSISYFRVLYASRTILSNTIWNISFSVRNHLHLQHVEIFGKKEMNLYYVMCLLIFYFNFCINFLYLFKFEAWSRLIHHKAITNTENSTYLMKHSSSGEWLQKIS